ncbi:hypothetical protein Y032_0212g2237 [Ancylostoma ceylanicum]|uniref:Uncharacterized protein n=1 Tax=Ancylostoma ceylanicum TaxID=53326 RepID=A0A016SJN4_9BILA|nr:hypothetical protein Y032_0212g2237 [Ancylostoma ceylanicum]
MVYGRNKRSQKYGIQQTEAYFTVEDYSLTNCYFSMLLELILNFITATTTVTLTATLEVENGMGLVGWAFL